MGRVNRETAPAGTDKVRGERRFERALVNTGFEQMNKPQWIPLNSHPKAGISKRRI